MRRTIALAAVLLLVVVWAVVPRAQLGFGQGRRRISPHESTEGTVDGAKVTIVYGRPSMRGREIFGALVPYDEVWCPGADEATMISTDRPLEFEGYKLAAGEYSIWILPTEAVWTLIFNSRAHTFHLNHQASADIGRVRLHKETLSAPIEQLTFSVDRNASGPGGAIVMRWAKTKVSAPFTVAR